jgi:excisionase family DNA binding protein
MQDRSGRCAGTFHIKKARIVQMTRCATWCGCWRVALPVTPWQPASERKRKRIALLFQEKGTIMASKPKHLAEPMLDIIDVADTCRVSEKTVRRWIKAGDLPAARLGNQWRIHPRDLRTFVLDRMCR